MPKETIRFWEKVRLEVLAFAVEGAKDPHADSQGFDCNGETAHDVAETTGSNKRTDFWTDEKDFHSGRSCDEKKFVMTCLCLLAISIGSYFDSMLAE